MLLLLEKLVVEPEHRALQSDPLTNYYCEVQLQMRKLNGNLFPIEERVSDPCFKVFRYAYAERGHTWGLIL